MAHWVTPSGERDSEMSLVNVYFDPKRRSHVLQCFSMAFQLTAEGEITQNPGRERSSPSDRGAPLYLPRPLSTSIVVILTPTRWSSAVSGLRSSASPHCGSAGPGFRSE